MKTSIIEFKGYKMMSHFMNKTTNGYRKSVTNWNKKIKTSRKKKTNFSSKQVIFTRMIK